MIYYTPSDHERAVLAFAAQRANQDPDVYLAELVHEALEHVDEVTRPDDPRRHLERVAAHDLTQLR